MVISCMQNVRPKYVKLAYWDVIKVDEFDDKIFFSKIHDYKNYKINIFYDYYYSKVFVNYC